MKKYILLILAGIFLAFAVSSLGFAAVEIPGGETIKKASIQGSIGESGSVGTEEVKNLGLQILNFLRMVISGLALIYIVLMGAYMVIFSDNESEITKQKRQLIYVLVAFLFLNLPGMIYDVMIGDPTSRGAGESIPTDTSWSSITITNGIFFNMPGVSSIIGGIINFLRVLVYGVAIVVLTWGAFEMIFGSHQDDARKKAQTKFLYGILGVIFMGFVDIWATTLSSSNIGQTIQTIGGPLIGIGVYFAAPVAVFFLIVGAYYFITSAGDEARAKKGKNIIINTLIAAVILIASFSFLKELVNIF